MMSIIEKIKSRFPNQNIQSKEIAKERLQLILTKERLDTSGKFIENFKADLRNVVLEYLEIDDTDIDIRLEKVIENGKYVSKIIANIPIKKMKKR